MTDKQIQEFNLEKSLKKLEDIVDKLDSSNTSLEKSLQLFEDGVNIIKLCEKHLSETEQKIEILVSSINNKFQTKPFEPESN